MRPGAPAVKDTRYITEGNEESVMLTRYSFYFLFYIGAQLINNVVLVSGVQQSDSVMHVHRSSFQILSPFRLSWHTEQACLCYTRGPCWLSV